MATRLGEPKGITTTHRAAGAINYIIGLHDLGPAANKALPSAVKRCADGTRKRPRKQAAVQNRLESIQVLEG